MEDRKLYVRIRADYVERMQARAWPNHRSLGEEVVWLAEWAIDELERRGNAERMVAEAAV